MEHLQYWASEKNLLMLFFYILSPLDNIHEPK